MIVEFDYYLHDDKESWYETVREALDRADIEEDEAENILQLSDRPFYEVTVRCTLNTENGKVTVIYFNGQ